MNTAPRLFIDAPLAAEADVALTPAQAHYLGTVMRRGVGDPVRMFNGRNGEWLAHVAALRRDRGTLLVASQLRAQAAEPDIWLVFALLKRDATDLVVQKATELGASVLLPVITERTNAGRVNETRLAAIATEAAEQSERLTVPVVQPPRRLEHVLADWPADRPLFAAIERAEAPGVRPCRTACGLLVGPEGGFSNPELDGLRRHPFLAVVSLGPRILRAETACLAGLALLQGPGCG